VRTLTHAPVASSASLTASALLLTHQSHCIVNSPATSAVKQQQQAVKVITSVYQVLTWISAWRPHVSITTVITSIWKAVQRFGSSFAKQGYSCRNVPVLQKLLLTLSSHIAPADCAENIASLWAQCRRLRNPPAATKYQCCNSLSVPLLSLLCVQKYPHCYFCRNRPTPVPHTIA
jgi:hypothetical protein